MSDLTGISSPGPSSGSGGGGIVRGKGHAPGQNLGEAMPDIPADVKPASLADMKRLLGEKNAGARSSGRQQPPTARNRIAEFDQQLQAKQSGQQQDPTRGQVGTPPKPEAQGDPNQLKEPGDGQAPTEQEAKGEPDPEAELEQPPEESALDPKKMAEWMGSDMFPEELEGKWLHELKANGITRYVDTAELKQGYIRGVDHRRGFEEVKQREARVEQSERAFQKHFEDVRDPAMMLKIYERQGYGETLMEVARLIARRDQDDRMQVNGAGYAAMQRFQTNDPNDHRVVSAMQAMQERIKQQRQTEIDRERLEFEKQELHSMREQQQSQAKVAEHHATYENQLKQLRPLAFRAFGIADSTKNRATYLKHLGAVIRQQPNFNDGITRDIALMAARDMAEERESEGQSERPPVGLSPERWARIQQQKRGKGEELPPTRTGGGGGQMRGAQGGERKSLRDLERMVRENRFRAGGR